MVTRKKGAADRKATGSKKAARKKAPKTKETQGRASGRKTAGVRDQQTSPLRGGLTSPVAGGRSEKIGHGRTQGSDAARKGRESSALPARLREHIGSLELERNQLREVIRALRAERDSALAEGNRMKDRIRELESETSRRSLEEPQQAGPGGFDPSFDLEEANEASEDEFEETAGFFDRIEDLRARRLELDRERADRELEMSDQPFWMVCPKCGELMDEQEAENVKLERCENCGGLYLDRGEVDLLVSLTGDRDGQRRVHNVLKF